MGDTDGTTAVQCSVIKHGRIEASTDNTVIKNEPTKTEPDLSNYGLIINQQELKQCISDYKGADNGNVSNNEDGTFIKPDNHCEKDDVEEKVEMAVEDATKEIKRKSSSEDKNYRKKKRKTELGVINAEEVNGVEEENDETYVPEFDELSEEDIEDLEEDEEDNYSMSEEESKPRKRGRVKKNPNLVPSHLTQDIALGYKILHMLIETPQFSIFQRPDQLNLSGGDDDIVCLNQIKRKFDDNTYDQLSSFVNDVRSMLSKIYESRNTTAIKKALRLEQLLEQRIAQLPNYIRPTCALALDQQELENSTQKSMNKGGSFVSLLFCRAEKVRQEKDREKRKVLAEERKHLKEEQDKDIIEWEKNVLLKDHEEEMRCMWELPQIGHFVHLCSNILNIGQVSQYEIERMLLMPRCSDTLDSLVTSLLSNSLVRAKLHHTLPMPYSIWLPLVNVRVNSWYRSLHKQNRQKVFEELGVEPMFWDVVGTEKNPLEMCTFHELPFLQRVWILKTLCDVDYVRKKTVQDNIRQQTLEELGCVNLGVDRHGNRYIYFAQFEDVVRIYRQTPDLEEGMNPADLVESTEGFDSRSGITTVDKIFKDVFDVTPVKEETPKKKVAGRGRKKQRRGRRRNDDSSSSIRRSNSIDSTSRGLRQSSRISKKISYVGVSESEESDGSDMDLATLKDRWSDAKTRHKPFSNNTFISYNVFRLPRDKVPQKPPNQRKSSYVKVADRLKTEVESPAKDKLQRDDEAEDSKDSKERDEKDEDKEFEEKEEDKDDKDNFTVKNLENLKMIFKKNADEVGAGESDGAHYYKTPIQFIPNRSKFYLVVDSIESLRQLISKFSSDENDLELIGSSRSGKKGLKDSESPSCEVQLIVQLQQLLLSLEQWEVDNLRTIKTHREKLYKDYTAFLERPSDFVHPNEIHWLKETEDSNNVVPMNPHSESTIITENNIGQSISVGGSSNDAGYGSSSQSTSISSTSNLDASYLVLRPRTRTRAQQNHLPMEARIHAEFGMDEDFEDIESPESDDNWEMPVSHKRRSGAVGGEGMRNSLIKSRSGFNRPGRSKPGKKSMKVGDVEKSKRTLFWSPRSSDPSEDLSWEANRQKLIEQRDSRNDVDGEKVSDGVLRSVKKYTSPMQRPRVAASVASIPGNKKPYLSLAQLKELDAKTKQVKPKKPSAGNLTKRRNPEIIDLDTDNGTVKVTAPTRSAIRPVSRPVPRVIGGKSLPNIPNSPVIRRSQPAPNRTIAFPPNQDIFLTDGVVFLRIDRATAEDVMNDSKIVEARFGDKLNIARGVQIITKTPAPQIPQQPVAQQSLPQTAVRAPALRFIRPQNMPAQALPTPTQEVQPVHSTLPQQPQPTSYVLVQGPGPGPSTGQLIPLVSTASSIGHLVPVSADGQRLKFIRPNVTNYVRLQSPNTQQRILTPVKPQLIQNEMVQIDNSTVPTSSQNFFVHTSLGLTQVVNTEVANQIVNAQPSSIISQPTNQIIGTSVALTQGQQPLIAPTQHAIPQQVPCSIATSGVRIVRPVQSNQIQSASLRLIRPGQTISPIQVHPVGSMRVVRPNQVVQTRLIRPPLQPMAQQEGYAITQQPTLLQTRLIRPPVPIQQQQPLQQIQQTVPQGQMVASSQPYFHLRPTTNIVQAQTRPLVTPLVNQTIRTPSVLPMDSTVQTQTLVRPLMTTGYLTSTNAGQITSVAHYVSSPDKNSDPKTVSAGMPAMVREDGTLLLQPVTLLQQQSPSKPDSPQRVIGSVRPTLSPQIRGQTLGSIMGAGSGPRLVTVVTPRGSTHSNTGAPTALYLQDGSRLLPLTPAAGVTPHGVNNSNYVQVGRQSGVTLQEFVQAPNVSPLKTIPRHPSPRQPTPLIRTPRKSAPTVSRLPPPMIKLDEEDEDVIEVAKDTNLDEVDILHGQLSAKQTPEGLKYTVKTSKGHEYVLSNEEVEARRAANDGRMY